MDTKQTKNTDGTPGIPLSPEMITIHCIDVLIVLYFKYSNLYLRTKKCILA